METISINDAKDRLAELVRAVEGGETIVLTRDGEPVAEIKPHHRKGMNYEALGEFKKKHGIERFVEHIPEDFDDPLPEDFLIRPLLPDP